MIDDRQTVTGDSKGINDIQRPVQRGWSFLLSENPALDAGFRERYAFDQKSSKP
jgi:hypothetical protein